MAMNSFVSRAAALLVLALLATHGFMAPAAARAGQTATGVSHEHPAATGDLDSTFGSGGFTTTDFFGSEDYASGLAIQSDGKIVLAGFALHGSTSDTSDFALARYNADGTLDSSFGAGGKVTTDFFGSRDVAAAVAIQPDGKIVAAGAAQNGGTISKSDFALARYNPDGSLDQSFGNGGKQTTDFVGFQDQATGLVLQTDGKIVLAGFASDSEIFYHFGMVRYNHDGSLDQTFGSAGKVTTDFSNFGCVGRAIAIEPDGNLVVAGYAFMASSTFSADFAVARYKSDGSLDQTFGAGGKLTTDFFGESDIAQALVIQSDGKILVSGFASHPDGPSDADFALARYNPNGSLDQSFGEGGKQTTHILAANDEASGIALEADGKIIAAGRALQSAAVNTSDFVLAQYNQNGNLDPTFASAGIQSTSFFGDYSQALAVAIQPNGKVVVAGATQHSNDFKSSDFAVARYNGPAPDFAIAFPQSSVTAQAGTKVPVTIQIDRLGGFTGDISVTPPPPQMGIKAKPQEALTIAGDTATFKVKVGSGVSPGSYDLTFSATDGASRTHTAKLTVVVQ